MIKQVEDIYNQYEKFIFREPKDYNFVLSSLMIDRDAVEYYKHYYIIDDCVVFVDDLLPAHDYRINQYSDTEDRMLDGNRMCLDLLIEHLTPDNYVEFEKLRAFLACKLNKNIAKIERIKREIAKDCNFPTSVQYEHKKYNLDEDSLFVEAFFVEKMKELVNVDILKKK